MLEKLIITRKEKFQIYGILQKCKVPFFSKKKKEIKSTLHFCKIPRFENVLSIFFLCIFFLK